MSPTPDPAELERLVGRVLADLPPKPAPGTLENRVLAAIVRHAALPWWRRSFLHWPMAARFVFFATSVGFVKLGLSLWDLVTATLTSIETTEIAAAAPGISWMRAAVDLAFSLGAAWRALSVSIPSLWLYAGGGMILSLYVLFFGISALGYRAFQASR
jgi:hypothetical protein